MVNLARSFLLPLLVAGLLPPSLSLTPATSATRLCPANGVTVVGDGLTYYETTTYLSHATCGGSPRVYVFQAATSSSLATQYSTFLYMCVVTGTSNGNWYTRTFNAADVSSTATCSYTSDGDCDDGGPGAEYTNCPLGTDTVDCGYRSSSTPDFHPRYFPCTGGTRISNIARHALCPATSLSACQYTPTPSPPSSSSSSSPPPSPPPPSPSPPPPPSSSSSSAPPPPPSPRPPPGSYNPYAQIGGRRPSIAVPLAGGGGGISLLGALISLIIRCWCLGLCCFASKKKTDAKADESVGVEAVDVEAAAAKVEVEAKMGQMLGGFKDEKDDEQSGKTPDKKEVPVESKSLDA